jgi:hypothetical protein
MHEPPVELLTGLGGYWDGESSYPSLGEMYYWCETGAVSYSAEGGPGSGPCCSIVARDGGYMDNPGWGWDAITQGDTSWNLWVKIDLDDGLSDIFGLYHVGGGGYFPTIGTYGHDCGVVWLNQDGSGSQTWPFVPLPVTFAYGEWFMVTVLLSAGRFRLYVNGMLAIDQSFDGFSDDVATEPFRINGRYWLWDGAWANFGFWTRTLEASEVTALYNDGAGLTGGELY